MTPASSPERTIRFGASFRSIPRCTSRRLAAGSGVFAWASTIGLSGCFTMASLCGTGSAPMRNTTGSLDAPSRIPPLKFFSDQTLWKAFRAVGKKGVNTRDSVFRPPAPRALDSQTPICQHPATETPASSFKIRAIAPEGRSDFLSDEERTICSA